MTVRIALASVAVVLAAMAYPWETTTDWWIFGIAVAVVVVVFAWWRGQFVTNMFGRRLAVFRRNHSTPKPQSAKQATVVLRVEDPSGLGVPLALVASYVERFGVRSEKVRVTNRDVDGSRTTWISLTLDAEANLVALQARSPELPLRETAEIAGRRLADHLREAGLDAVPVDDSDAPLIGKGREKWRGVHDEDGFVSAYGIPVDERLGELLDEVRSQSSETWTAVEFSGSAAHPTVAAVCAFRTPEPVRGAPVSGLAPHRGVQRPLLTALDPKAVGRFDLPAKPVTVDQLSRIDWPAGNQAELSRT
ncbi:type VII secretion protein EccE [Mycolicibacterium novocastrense]|uniref:Type VII secretion protein EccE n=1 Tax=Mycolicibacterium novocastrense TaxID=59813 RepID=A0AAW5SHB7_MYCNV|nr:type VII secretion protein EccE [Mycolicibacterium novocastrense]KUH72433.1 type VII secretion protein EccE [Mycolicibacterium novocastrense]KUH72874.1 type VII secretion protein EccE [Mycolicibacterium novocastrense]KUH77052.1 type VII secretion protein EccE [Mycolicibacterium novocastrense]MCV7023162.1 type VII secretion protein EccE [Mycolicibacterium novocastrense]GAT10743.1 type VII secretion protein EccE [Mycolicibacterium novocastrense]